ncbi:MAG: hypothetical protein CM15mP23_18430 [Cryomorphaceae bacterium]|nr:MAG: hypothetical protein CM15mP23_18430 [Cryomorphaceae bacterium]
MDENADNYNDYDLDSLSNILTGNVLTDINTNDDDLCIYFGCIQGSSFNFDSLANTNDNTCYPVITGCLDENADNFNDFDGDGIVMPNRS